MKPHSIIILLGLYLFNCSCNCYQVGETTNMIVHAGKDFEIYLPEIPSTGYVNYIDSTQKLNNVSFVSSSLKYNFTFWRKVTGNGARRTFYFHANKEGMDTIILYREAKMLKKNRTNAVFIIKIKQ